MTTRIPLTSFDAVAWDFDGTLADTIGAHTEARIHAFPLHGILDITPEQHASGHRHGNSPPTIIGGILIAAGRLPKNTNLETDPLVADIVATKTDYYRKLAKAGLPEHAGATDLYRRTVGLKGIEHVSIATNAARLEVTPFVAKYRLNSYLRDDLLISSETIKNLGLQLKPEPDIYLLAAERMGVNPARMLVIEDNAGGVEAGRQAGCPVLVVGTTNPRDYFDAALPADRYTYFAPNFDSVEFVD